MSDTITCPRCGMTSANPNDVREGYCGNCHDWTTDSKVVRAGSPELQSEPPDTRLRP